MHRVKTIFFLDFHLFVDLLRVPTFAVFLAVQIELVVFITNADELVQAGPKHFPFIWVHLKLDIESHFLLDFIDPFVEMLDHALEVKFIGSSNGLYGFFWLENMAFKHFEFARRLEQIFPQGYQLFLKLNVLGCLFSDIILFLLKVRLYLFDQPVFDLLQLPNY
jgi:hypothetical protein